MGCPNVLSVRMVCELCCARLYHDNIQKTRAKEARIFCVCLKFAQAFKHSAVLSGQDVTSHD